MTALDADTLRDLVERGPVLPISADLDPTFTTIVDARGLTVAQHVPRSWARLIVALVNAAPALLDAAEAVERIRTLADEFRESTNPWVVYVIESLRAALAPPPDPLAYTTHDDYDDEEPE